MFGRGYGVDTIADRDATEGNIDVIRFLDDVASEDVVVRRSGNSLELSILGTEDKLIIEQYFSRYYYSGWYSYDVGENGNKIEQIIFADGTTWDIADIKEMARTISGTAGDDYIGGFDDQDDLIDAGDGNDSIYSGAGNDVVNAGAGDDVIDTASGNDVIYAGAGNDTVNAGSGDDIIDGGAGNDRLLGDSGNDIYIFGRGYGYDTIADRDATEGNLDIVQFKADILPTDVTVTRSGNDLLIVVNGTDDSLRIEQYFSRYFYSGWYSYDIGENGNKIEEFHFDNGTIWTIADIKEMARNITGTAGDDSLTGYDDQDNTLLYLMD
jgi:Ca2+-binding RTX toxin-like protein